MSDVKLDERVATAEQRVQNLEKQLDKNEKVADKIDEINKNVYSLSGEIKGLVTSIQTQNERIIDFKKAMDRLEVKIDEKIDTNYKEVNEAVNKLSTKIETIENKQRDLEQNPFREKVTAWEDTKRKVLVGVATAAAVSVLGAAVTVIVHFIRTGIIG